MSSDKSRWPSRAIFLGVALAFGVSNALAVEDVSRAAEPVKAEKGAIGAVRAAPHELLVKFKNTTLPRDNTLSTLRAALPATADQALGMLQAEVIEANPETGLVHLRYGANLSVLEAARQLEQSGAVLYAEPNYRIRSGHVGVKPKDAQPLPVARLPRPVPAAAVTPNDPRFAEQWGLNNTGQTGGEADADIDAVEAWGVTTNGATTIVAVLGPGIDYKHVDLKANIWKNPREICGDGIDNDANGYKDDCYGMDAYLNSGDPLDDNGWGTHMAGIVGAVGNNGVGIAGVAWRTQLMALRYEDSEGWGWVADAVQAIDYAIKIKDRNAYPRMVLLTDNLYAPYSKALNDILTVAQTKGILVVTGSRDDDNHNQDHWPGVLSGWYGQHNIISVSGSDARDYRPGWGYGQKSVDLAAPGTDILSTWLTNTYKLGSGTAMSAAHVAGSAALVWSKYPTYNWKQVKGLILNGAEDGLHRAFYWGLNLTQGRLNLNTSLSAATINTPAVFAVNPEITQVGQPITLTGINFGSTRGALLQDDDCIYNYPAGSIISWNNERIVVRVSGNCRYGEGLLKAKVGAKLSRGAFFRTNLNEYNYTHWLYPTYQGETLLQHQEAASAQVGNDVWIFGGRDNYNDSSNRVERFSLLTLRGEVQPDWEMPKGIRNASAAAIGTKIYVVGGYDDATKKLQSQLQIFDTVTRMWTRGRNLPQPLSDASVIAVSNQIWVMGGSGVNNTGLKTTYLYDPVTNRWLTDKASLPLKRANAGVATPRAGKIWLVSGYTESGGSWYRTKDVLEYDIATNTWDIRDDIPLNGEHAGAAVTSMNGKTFAIYGDGDGGAGEWLPAPGPSEGLKWSRNIAHFEYQPTYTPMIGTNLNTRTIYIISGSRGRSVFKFEIP